MQSEYLYTLKRRNADNDFKLQTSELELKIQREQLELDKQYRESILTHFTEEQLAVIENLIRFMVAEALKPSGS